MVLVWFAAGLAALALILLAARAFVRASPTTLALGLRWAAATLLAVLAAVLFVVKQVIPAFLVMGLALWIVDRLPAAALNLFGLGGLGRLGGLGTGAPRPGRVSTIESPCLRMTLDHDSGVMTGTVLEGRFRGRTLADLDRADLLALLADLRVADERGAALLEAYLDRVAGADWRDDDPATAEDPAAPPPPSGDLAREEAYRILGLEPGAPDEAGGAAPPPRVRQVHPDKGGSAWLAARINAAKDLLLGRAAQGRSRRSG